MRPGGVPSLEPRISQHDLDTLEMGFAVQAKEVLARKVQHQERVRPEAVERTADR